MNADPATTLQAGIQALGLSLEGDTQEKLLAYLALLHKWNVVYNLTAIRDPGAMVSHHLLDSLAVLPHLWPGRWLDVGCGGGTPGLVLAMARPEWSFTLLDSNSKKTGFVQQAVIELGLKNVKVHPGRVEQWQSPEKFEGIISRAFAELADFLRLTRHLLAPGGRWAAMKGRVSEELVVVPGEFEISKVIQLTVPGVAAERNLVLVKVAGE
ncbi:MAG: 16S rRNA (guanine(527)-N(7))-methyltransferase RsmG [Sideroxydans sp.]